MSEADYWPSCDGTLAGRLARLEADTPQAHNQAFSLFDQWRNLARDAVVAAPPLPEQPQGEPRPSYETLKRIYEHASAVSTAQTKRLDRIIEAGLVDEDTLDDPIPKAPAGAAAPATAQRRLNSEERAAMDRALWASVTVVDEGHENASSSIRASVPDEPQPAVREDASFGESGQVYGIIDPDYGRIYSIARLLAWSEGYALTLHGSFTRDLDLLAVPWADTACDPEHLVRRLLASTDLLRAIHRDDSEPGPPSDKPHGRKVWTLMFKAFGDPRFVDLSIMPRTEKPR